jgi:predicted Fe-Mo cluster-binding NifX family protein
MIFERVRKVKVAIVTDDNRTVSPHFGRAQYYLVYEISDGKVLSKETRPKSSHNHREVVELRSNPDAEKKLMEQGQHHEDAASEATLHDVMLSNVRDCEALIARGMGAGMYGSIRQLGIRPYVTNVATADDAVQAYIDGSLDSHTERLH